MTSKIEELVSNAKISELLHKNKVEDERKSRVLWFLAIVGAVASIAAIAFAVVKFVIPKYYDDFDGDFDYDELDDDFDFDDDDVEDVHCKSDAE